MYSCCLNDNDSIVRYCSQTRYDKKQNKIIPEAFELRVGEEYLSCYWKDFYKGSNLKKIYKEAKDSGLVINEKGAFATLTVRDIKQIGHNNNIINIMVKHLKVFRSYSGIYNTTNDFKFRRDLVLKAKINAIDTIV